MITLNHAGNVELPACDYALVGVFDLKRVIAEFGPQAAADFAIRGNPRKYWNGKNNGFTRSVLLKTIPGREGERHPPIAVFVAIDSVNIGNNHPPVTELLDYRKAYPCLIYKDHWMNWSDVVSAFNDCQFT